MTADVATTATGSLLKCPLGSSEIYDILPHAYPFLMIDRVVSVDTERVVAVKCVTSSEWWTVGHYPGDPIMPGVLILETMAHVGGLIEHARALTQPPASGRPRLSVLAGVKRVRFREMVRPGDQLRVTATHLASAASLSEFRCEAHVGSTLVAEATLSLMSVTRQQHSR
jgi:3-hydroxyacyl-[acyl-carrier-protein] dehydratase